MSRIQVIKLLLFLSCHSSCLAADYVPPENRASSGQRKALFFFMTTCVLLGGYAVYLHWELARVTVRRLFGGLTAPLLSQQNDDDAEMELDYRPGNYQVPLSSP
jgi:hypothetical protein